jgi:hypothetical protein
MPLIVLTAGRRTLPPGMPADVREQAALFSGRYGPGRTPTLRCPHADTTSSSRIPGMLSSSRILRWFSRRSTACWQRSGRSRPKNRRSTNRLISTNAFGLRKKHSLSRHGSDFWFTCGKSDGLNRRRQNLSFSSVSSSWSVHGRRSGVTEEVLKILERLLLLQLEARLVNVVRDLSLPDQNFLSS